MRPLQVWLPTFEGSINLPHVSRDAQRAFRCWKDEVSVWLLPELSYPVRWEHQGLRCLAIPAEHFERIDIGHIDAGGRLYAPTADWLPKTIDGLLGAWLDAIRSGEVDLIPPINESTPVAPLFDSDPPRWEQRKVTFGPGPLMPTSSFKAATSEVMLAWPPEGSPLPISAEAESAERFPLEIAADNPDEAITPDGKRALRVLIEWPEPLFGLMPVLSGADDLLAQQMMEQLARYATENHSAALIRGSELAASWIFPGDSIAELSWLRPAQRAGAKEVILNAEDKSLFIPAALRYKDPDEIVKQLLAIDEWQQFLKRREPIRRVWGGVGVFWSLLLE